MIEQRLYKPSISVPARQLCVGHTIFFPSNPGMWRISSIRPWHKHELCFGLDSYGSHRTYSCWPHEFMHLAGFKLRIPTMPP